MKVMIGMAELAGVVPGDMCRTHGGHEIPGGQRLVRVITTRAAFRAAIRRRRLNKTTRIVRVNVWEDGTLSSVSTFLDPRDAAAVAVPAALAMPAPEWVR